MMNDGGPAFPASGGGYILTEGMSIRDLFAVMAMHGMLADQPDITTIALAHEAYHIADAMLKAREATE